jgi:hypothetical protein
MIIILVVCLPTISVCLYVPANYKDVLEEIIWSSMVYDMGLKYYYYLLLHE